ncbi:LacI family DNA-binding transcriptional regulator [Streptomyces sp. NPDC019396]|uniref:LacI family DNA-binding transcriptional regulator n=1 Tax=Streptomyces sp. NPDC019396 TaxID=3154687 RepID=UPI00340DD0F1
MASRLMRVAEYAGVSEATVSRVLNGKPGVAEATRASVLTAMDVLGYERPVPLRGRANPLVGLVVPEMGNPVFPAYTEVIGSGLARGGYTSILCTGTAAGVRESDFADTLLEHQVAGVIFVSGEHSLTSRDHGHYVRLRERGLPAVVINGVADGLDLPCLSTDDAASVRLAVRHLVQLGHVRIGLAVGDLDHIPAARKAQAFRDETAILAGHRGHGDAERFIAPTLYSLEGGSAAAMRLFREGVTAVVCGSDVLALGVIQAARRSGLDVPGDVSVVGFDDSAFMPFADPPLTTIRQPIDALGLAAVNVLLCQVSGKPIGDTDEMLFAPELVVRASTGSAPRRRP